MLASSVTGNEGPGSRGLWASSFSHMCSAVLGQEILGLIVLYSAGETRSQFDGLHEDQHYTPDSILPAMCRLRQAKVLTRPINHAAVVDESRVAGE